MTIANSPRCGAKSRSGRGSPCRHVALANGRCYYHGGRSSGPKTEAGKLKCKQVNITHGHYTREAIAERRDVRDFIKECIMAIKE